MSDAAGPRRRAARPFLREAQAAGSLQHPNVVTVYDFGEVDGHLYIAMEFVAGEDLEEMLARRRRSRCAEDRHPRRRPERLSATRTSAASSTATSSQRTSAWTKKAARASWTSASRICSRPKMTRTGLMVGTPAYMAPEQITSGTISAATDIFSIGAVMYELLTGNKPFEGESLQSVFYKIVSSAPPDIMTVAPSLPVSLNTIVMRALAKEPAARFANAMDMANALTETRAAVERDPTQPKAVSLQSVIATRLSTRATKKIPVYKKKSSVVVAGGAATLIVLGGMIYINSRPHATRSESPPPAAQPPASTASAPVQAPAVPAGSPAASQPASPPARRRRRRADRRTPRFHKGGADKDPTENRGAE